MTRVAHPSFPLDKVLRGFLLQRSTSHCQNFKREFQSLAHVCIIVSYLIFLCSILRELSSPCITLSSMINNGYSKLYPYSSTTKTLIHNPISASCPSNTNLHNTFDSRLVYIYTRKIKLHGIYMYISPSLSQNLIHGDSSRRFVDTLTRAIGRNIKNALYSNIIG
ncbi:hypothetical protein TSAR_011631 [Trichomalopsis sarcophagae]|uniref:Uncharacterized protein n=1 Tax=Trichomalopsis sarcophagae TaxID=543379 RepID=A0A232FEP4_9HYME|nr:hypothetical protein TSAR_011631 [Trichomalopsis sarcophagae]